MARTRNGVLTGSASITLALCLFAAPATPAADCNGNGVEDWLEVTGGSQPDCNGNDIPDPCDLLPVNYGLAARGGLSAGFQILSAVAADLDGDGAIDLAASSVALPVVGILWNGGRGSFSEPEVFPIKDFGIELAAADLDGDLRRDLVITTTTGISFLINRGSRRFSTAALEIDAANLPVRAPVLADLDGDGDVDLALLGPFRVIILMNQGSGVFVASGATIPIGSNPVALAAARLDGDADIDLITANRLEPPGAADNASVLLNRGAAMFDSPRNFGVGKEATSITTGDLDGDGDTDAVVACIQSGVLSVLLGAGDGSFTPGTDVPVEGSPGFVSLHDVDQDGDLDLAFSWIGFSQSGFAGVRLNHGDGSFARAIEFPSLVPPNPLLIADLTRDGSLEIVAVLPATELGSLLVLERVPAAHDTDCDGTGVPDGCDLEGSDCNGNHFLDVCDISSGVSFDCDRNRVPDECDPDCNGNGTPDACDVAAGKSPDCNSNGLPDECDVGPSVPRFEHRWVDLSGNLIHALGTADLDADGRADIFGVQFPSSILVFWGEGQGKFAPPVDFGAGGTFQTITDVDAGDVDGDGDLDVIAIKEFVSILVLAQEVRSFAVTVSIETPGLSSPVALGDLEGDGDLDIAVAENGRATFFGNDGAGVFSILHEPGIPLIPGLLLLTDLDGDGQVDLVARNPETGFLRVFWNETGSFQPDVDILGGTPPIPGVVSAVDLDGDSDHDLLTVVPGGFSLARQEAPRQFGAVDVLLGLLGSAFRANDLDRDGDVDVVFPASLLDGTQNLFIIRNTGGGAFDAPIGLSVDGQLGAITSGDYDGDGAMDVAALGKRLCQNCGQVSLAILLNRTQPSGSTDTNGNGRPDECDSGAFRRGDSGGDGSVDLADAVFTLRALFQGGPAPGCAEAGDADNDGKVDVTDPVLILEFLFRGGPPPSPPGPGSCGLDPDPDGAPGDLGCGSYGSC